MKRAYSSISSDFSSRPLLDSYRPSSPNKQARPRPKPLFPYFDGCSHLDKTYQILGKLGEGTFGEVYKARRRGHGEYAPLYALKKILMHNEKEGFPITALREIKIIKMLNHVNVIPLVEMAVERGDRKQRKRGLVYMVTPYMDHDLAGLLENPNIKFSPGQNKILHRDIKAANLLINNRGILKIADFGLARPYDEDPPRAEAPKAPIAQRDYTNCVVTRWYRPPELLLGTRRYTTAIDLWGVGCVMGEMLKETPILQGSSDMDQLDRIFRLVGSPNEENMSGFSQYPGYEGVKAFSQYTSSLQTQFGGFGVYTVSLLSGLLTLDPQRRLAANEALRDEWFFREPLPADPGDLPSYEASHEYDRRNRNGNNPPPAPTGGSVGYVEGSGPAWIRRRPRRPGPYFGRGTVRGYGRAGQREVDSYIPSRDRERERDSYRDGH